jgi:hypothetical protein
MAGMLFRLETIHAHNSPFEIFAGELNRVRQRESGLPEGHATI